MLDASRLRGVWTALVTPFEGKRVNLKILDKLVGKMADAGLAGVVPLGTTGESPTLSAKERRVVLQRTIASARGSLAVLAGAGSNSTSKTVQWVHEAAQAGADGVLIVAPYYNKPTTAGLKNHFLTVADNSPLPIVLYHIPGRCGIGIPVDLVIELAHHPRIIGIKEAGGDLWRSAEIVRRAPPDFAVLSGDDTLTLPLLAVGAVGTIAVISNIAPELTKRMVGAALSGDYAQALELNQNMAPLLNALCLETNPGPIKAALRQVGLKVGDVRPPLAPVTHQTLRKIQTALKQVGEIQ